MTWLKSERTTPAKKQASPRPSATGAGRQNTKKILVLGSKVSAGKLVTSHEWTDIPEGLNVADCDVLILDLIPLYDEAFGQAMDRQMVSRLPGRDGFWRHYFSPDTETIVLGSPETWMGDPRADFERSSGWGLPRQFIERTDWWQPPGFPERKDAAGETVRVTKPEWDFYFETVKRWGHYFSSNAHGQEIPSNFFRSVCPKGNSIKFHVEPIAENRQRDPLGLTFHLAIGRMPEDRWGRVREGEPAEPLVLSSPLIVLPPPTEIEHTEAVELILTHRYKVDIQHETPRWVENFLLPEQQKIREEIDQSNKQIVDLTQRINSLQSQLDQSLRIQRVLYGTGDELEELVWELLRDLGATVTQGPHKRRDDGRLQVPGHPGLLMLEIKGRQKSMKLEDIRQLAGWIKSAETEEKLKTDKGLFVGCGYIDEHPNQRKCIFPDNAIREGEAHGFALLNTSQLLEAVHSRQRGKLTPEFFWGQVMATRGLFK